MLYSITDYTPNIYIKSYWVENIDLYKLYWGKYGNL